MLWVLPFCSQSPPALSLYGGSAYPEIRLENLFQRMKVFSCVATRFDKLDVTFLGFVHIAGIMKWLR